MKRVRKPTEFEAEIPFKAKVLSSISATELRQNLTTKIGWIILSVVGMAMLGILGLGWIILLSIQTIGPTTNNPGIYLGIGAFAGLAMAIIGQIKIRQINVQRRTLPDISRQLESGEQVLQNWPSALNDGFLRKKYVIFSLTNKRILTVNTTTRTIEYSITLSGLVPIAKNKKVHTITRGGYGSTDSSGNLYIQRGSSSSTVYGDIDFFRGNTVVYHLSNIPDPDSAVARIKQVQGSSKEYNQSSF